MLSYKQNSPANEKQEEVNQLCLKLSSHMFLFPRFVYSDPTGAEE